jgi:cephalosporin-C deacetylase-like acetyl esterase
MLIFFLLVCTLLSIFLLPFWLLCSHPFPPPSGQWRVGTTELTWNSANDIGIIAKIWYPTKVSTGIPSSYIDNIGRTLPVMTAWLNPLFKLIFGRIITPAFINATPDRSSARFPLILLSPGFGLMNWLNTFYALEFASHGFIVIGINHPGSSSVTFLADGSQVKFNSVEKEVFEDIDRLESLLAGIAVQQANNISIILDTVVDQNSTANSFLYQMIDTSKIFTAGHSLGGTSSFIACGQDDRITKGINFDGYSFIDDINTDYTGKELLLINSDLNKQRPKNKTLQIRHDATVERDKIRIEQLAVKANLKEIIMPSANHSNFTDLPLVIRPIFARAIGLVGKLDGLDLLLKTSAISMDFLDN